jgi:hypothetical protein
MPRARSPPGRWRQYAWSVGLSEGELAERSGSSVQRVRELKSFGILVEQDDGRFSAKDVHRVRLMQAFDEAGIDLEVIARGISAGKLGYENIELLLFRAGGVLHVLRGDRAR